jgi:hypothetical protein
MLLSAHHLAQSNYGDNTCHIHPPKGPDVLIGNVAVHTRAINQELPLLAHIIHASSIGTHAMPCDHTQVHIRHAPYILVPSTHMPV